MELKSKKKEKIKKYLILLLIFVAGIGITLYLCNLYHVYDEYQKQTPVIRGTLSEITSEELDHYLQENPTSVLYLCTSSETVCRNFEKEFKKLIEKQSLQEYIVYLNLSDVNQSEFVQKFNETYPSKKELTTNYPALIYIEDGKLKHLIQGSKNKPLTITKTKQFIELNSIGE